MPRKGSIKKPSIHAYVDEQTKIEFVAAARQHGAASEAEFLKAVLQHVLKSGRSSLSPESIDSSQSGVRGIQMNLLLTQDENHRLVEVSNKAGLRRTSWTVNLIRAHLYKAEQFTDSEINALYESNRQIAAIGRNLNQIARNLNANLNASQSVTVDLIEDLSKELRGHRRSVSALVNANLDRWGVEK